MLAVLLDVVSSAQILSFYLLVLQKESVVEIDILPLLLNMQKLRQQVPLLVYLGQQTKGLLHCGLDVRNVDLTLGCLFPQFSAFLAILAYCCHYVVVYLLGIQNFKQLDFTTVDDLVEGVRLLLQHQA
jgi:hypothetical protein